MKQPKLTRRQFFKLSAFGASALASSALGLGAVAAAPTQEALAAAQQPQSPAMPQPTFTSIASSTLFGPLTDISMGSWRRAIGPHGPMPESGTSATASVAAQQVVRTATRSLIPPARR